MSANVLDIQLTVDQENAVINLVDKLHEPAFGKLKSSNKLDRQSKPHFLEWVLYLMQVALESSIVRNNKKSRTVTKRKTHLQRLKKLLGHYPTDDDIQELFGDEASKQQELIALLQADVRQLQEYKPIRKTELEKIRERLVKLQKRLDKK